MGERWESDVRAMVVKSRRKKARIVPLFGDGDKDKARPEQRVHRIQHVAMSVSSLICSKVIN